MHNIAVAETAMRRRKTDLNFDDRKSIPTRTPLAMSIVARTAGSGHGRVTRVVRPR